jgi:copper homeostasis protein
MEYDLTYLEVIATSLEDAIAAEQGGAHSVEVCIDLPADGLTPPLALVQAIRDRVQIAMNVMIRPHNNGFVYDATAIEGMLVTIADLKCLAIQTLVFGAHRADGTLDLALIQRIAAAADPIPLTVHRALERSSNPDAALPQLVGVAQRILTSGPAASAPEGCEGLRRWVTQFGEHFRFAAAGGIRLDNIRAIADATGVSECHVGSAARTNNRVDVDKVRQLARLQSTI